MCADGGVVGGDGIGLVGRHCGRVAVRAADCRRDRQRDLAAPPLANVPRSQITVPVACRQDPDDVVALTNVAPSGSVSTRRTFVAGAGPAFDTFIEYEKGVPIATGVPGAVAATWTSAAEPTAPTVMVTVR